MRLVPDRQLPYLRTHPLGACVAFGIAVEGLINLSFPEQASQSAASIAFPLLIFYFFNAVWLIGGALSVSGLVRGWRGAEAAGATLLAGGLGLNFAVIVSIRGLTAVFVLMLAVGYALRVRHLVTEGYAEGHRLR